MDIEFEKFKKLVLVYTSIIKSAKISDSEQQEIKDIEEIYCKKLAYLLKEKSTYAIQLLGEYLFRY